jgi:hypothetical protein
MTASGHSRPSHPAALAGHVPEFSKTEHGPKLVAPERGIFVAQIGIQRARVLHIKRRIVCGSGRNTLLSHSFDAALQRGDRALGFGAVRTQVFVILVQISRTRMVTSPAEPLAQRAFHPTARSGPPRLAPLRSRLAPAPQSFPGEKHRDRNAGTLRLIAIT